MKKLLLFPIVLLSFLKINSQVVFCPPGAEWRYTFTESHATSITNEKIIYAGTYTLAGETVKRLDHMKIFKAYTDGTFVPQTFIKQSGDTIFMKNYGTSNQWQILYNFAAQPGQGWANTLSDTYGPTLHYYVKVDSVKTVIINGTSLKRLYVTYDNDINGWGTSPEQAEITERFGCNVFMFNYYSRPRISDDDWIKDFLCYKDDSFGTKQFTSKPCEYANIVGLANSDNITNNFSVFPNPCNNTINLSLENQNSFSELEIRIVNLLGEEMLIEKNLLSTSQTFQVDMSPFRSGIYFVQLYENKKLVGTQKLIKD